MAKMFCSTTLTPSEHAVASIFNTSQALLWSPLIVHATKEQSIKVQGKKLFFKVTGSILMKVEHWYIEYQFSSNKHVMGHREMSVWNQTPAKLLFLWRYLTSRSFHIPETIWDKRKTVIKLGLTNACEFEYLSGHLYG